ncbi:MAG: RhtB family transporter [Rhodospirillales bacterium 70-18]|nr:LysE family translocator [Rhodospirillales bacterium]OJY71516.1 MAG: RhtB family transporter [Rhodospirillales bacterium 70-18]
MFDPSLFALFLAAALAIALAPGPGMLYVAGRTLAGGRAEGLASSLGTGLGGLVHVLAAAIGLSALIAASAAAFEVLKLAGAAYLIYLGIQAWRAGDAEIHATPSLGARRAFRQGVLVEATNPKTATFFLAFFPQFTSPAHGHLALQFAVLGLVAVILNTAADVAVTFAAGAVRHHLVAGHTAARRIRKATAALFCGLGVSLALSHR